ncbi:DUF1214 domain-containing protein [uncultured Parvibaculum sp.]|uniref:DUF1214 domain-containing protein n=1 Tax=uncultured Parvibaculum sp. TaxID=291828 RepID=UPI0030DC574B|tara:strand:- start:119859 stop:120473 length:615 start_codon:yes stop_codon:yes gene_type:complete
MRIQEDPGGGLLKLVLKLLASFSVALILGVGSALLLLGSGGLGGTIAIGPWESSDVIGSSEADPYTRARVAIAGLLALNRNETIYFTAATDDEGAPLRTECTYNIFGSDPPARWWSITAYAADHYLIPNPHDRYSYGGNTVAREEDNSFVISIGRGARDGNWIPTGENDGSFTLTLRLYNPSEAAARDPSGIVLPRIAREACSQ